MEKKKKHCDRQKMFFLGTVVMVFCITFCSSAQNIGPRNKVISSMADLNDTPVASAKRISSYDKENTDQHPFQCGDAVGITVAPDTASFLTGQYPIDDEGNIYLPLLGKKQVTSMTQEELTSYIKNSFMQYLHYPGVRVQALIRLELMGGFQRPGFYYISPRASFWEVFRLAGAPLREDGIEKLKIKRSEATIDFDPVLSIEKAQSLDQMGIRSGDRIMVTVQPLKTGWETFRDDILPILGLALSLAATTATAYISYETYLGGR